MTQVDERENDMMRTQEMGILAVIADQQSAELVDPGEIAFAAEAPFVDVGVEQALASASGRLAVALVLCDVRDHLVVEAHLARRTGVERAVRVEERTGKRQTQALHALESRLEMRLEVERIMAVSGHNAARSDDIALGVGDGQDIAGLGALAPLVGHALAALLGDGMTAIQIQLAQVEVITHALDARLPHLRQAAITAPLAKVVVDRLPTDLLFFASSGSGAMGNRSHWQPVWSRYKM